MKTALSMRNIAQTFRPYRLRKLAIAVLRTIFLVGLAYVICFPLLVKLSSAFMSSTDILDSTVIFIPKHPTLQNLQVVLFENDFLPALLNTAGLSLLYGLMQAFFTCTVGYGLASYKVPLKRLWLVLVILTLLIPPQTLQISMYSGFRYIDPFSLFSAIFGEPLNLINTIFPIGILSVTGLAFKNGMYILLFYQFFKGVPRELYEAAEVDGAGIFRTYFRIIFPTSTPILITVFLLAFSWQWTDTHYTGLFFTNVKLLSTQVLGVGSNTGLIYSGPDYISALINTASLLALLPLLIIYVFAQRYILQGIESSGIVG